MTPPGDSWGSVEAWEAPAFPVGREGGREPPGTWEGGGWCLRTSGNHLGCAPHLPDHPQRAMGWGPAQGKGAVGPCAPYFFHPRDLAPAEGNEAHVRPSRFQGRSPGKGSWGGAEGQRRDPEHRDPGPNVGMEGQLGQPCQPRERPGGSPPPAQACLLALPAPVPSSGLARAARER